MVVVVVVDGVDAAVYFRWWRRCFLVVMYPWLDVVAIGVAAVGASRENQPDNPSTHPVISCSRDGAGDQAPHAARLLEDGDRRWTSPWLGYGTTAACCGVRRVLPSPRLDLSP